MTVYIDLGVNGDKVAPLGLVRYTKKGIQADIIQLGVSQTVKINCVIQYRNVTKFGKVTNAALTKSPTPSGNRNCTRMLIYSGEISPATMFIAIFLTSCIH